MENKKVIYINGREVKFSNERNLLEVIRNSGIDIPTFCYHSELSVYGACRLCLVDVEGKGLVSSCSITPEPGMRLKTHTQEIREIRKISLELLLADHDQSCTTCPKSSACRLQEIAYKLGVDEVRFKKTESLKDIDISSDALVRDPNKCILCGDCVRACYELQGIGAIDFAYRGSKSAVLPAFDKDLSQVECVDCGQCARVCPTGAIIPKSQIENVWKDIDDPNKKVVAQIAPAVRVSIGEMFGMKPGTVLTGQIVAALKLMGFDKVFDTSFAADLTVIEEASEFLERKKSNKKLPQMTSCCPAWVKYAEQYYPEFIDNLSSCKSPQQMFGSVAKEILPKDFNTEKENVVVVSIMPCTAKKFEANRPEFSQNGIKEVDHVITTQELAKMIKESGLKFEELAPESLDMPMGFKTGAGVIFGNSGGVSEAVLRCASEKASGVKLSNADFYEVRGDEGVREIEVDLNGEKIKIAILHGLKNAGEYLDKVEAGEKEVDLIEVMSCPGGCIGGAGQPVSIENVVPERKKGLYKADKMLQLHKSQDNPYINDLYKNHLEEIGGKKSHQLLHTNYKNRKRLFETELSLIAGTNPDKLEIKVCVGTNCYLKGSQNLLHKLIDYIDSRGLTQLVDVKATFCMENCDNSASVTIGDKLYSKSNLGIIIDAIEEEVSKLKIEETI